MMSQTEVLRRHLASGMDGTVSVPGEPAYDRAVSIWAKPRVLPRLVAHCESVRDVQHAVRSAREADILLSVRGGGHDWTGRALCDGLTLDMSRMNEARRTSDDELIEVGGGTKGTDLFSLTDPAGLAPVLGSVAGVGLASVVTGGGYGPLMRKFGLACDNLHSATLVLADGSAVRAAEDSHRELFWAIRGGGGNFGVITSLELQLHQIPSVRSGVLLFPFEAGSAVLPRLEEIWSEAPLELDVQFGLVSGPDGKPVLYLSPTWCGEPERADLVLAPLYALEGKIMDDVRDQPFGASRAFFDKHIVNGLVTTADSLWLRGWSGEIAALVMGGMRRRPSDLCFILCHEFSGAAAQIPADATAFGLRQRHVWFEVIAQSRPDGGGDGSAETAWVQEVAQALSPHAFPGAYPNMLAPTQRDRIKHSFGSNAARLLAAKRRYDPDNVFRSAISLPNTGAG
jgi:hypothetical protein